jgi:hypothetical protein
LNNRNRRRRHRRHAERQQKHRYQNNGKDGNQQFLQKMADRFADYFRLFGYAVDIHARRQGGFELRQAVLDFRPNHVFIAYFVGKFYENVSHSVFGFGRGFSPLHLGVGKKVTFERFRQLFLYLLRAGARIYAYHNALPDNIFGHLLLGHYDKRINARNKQRPNQQKDDLPVLHGPLNDFIVFLHFVTLNF